MDRNPDRMQKFSNKLAGMSCCKTGELIPVGTSIYAENADLARNGAGLCESAYLDLAVDKPKAKAEKPTKTADTAASKKSSKAKG